MFLIVLKTTLESLWLQFMSRECGLFRRKGANWFLSFSITICVISSTPLASASEKTMNADQLEKELGHYKEIAGLEAHFQQVKEFKALKISLKSEGKFRMSRENGQAVVEWQILKPAFLKLKISEKSLEIFEQPGQAGKPLLENQTMQAKVLKPLYAWLSMNGRFIAEQYDVFPEGKGKFRLQPKEKDAPINSVVIALGTNQLVEKVTIMERSGDDIKISFTETKTESRK